MRSTLLAAAVLLLACFSRPFQSDDAWSRLAVGRYIVQNHKLPAPDPFDFTTYIGAPDPARQSKIRSWWPAHAAMYLAYSAAGFAGVVLLRALVLIFASALVAYWVWRKTRNFYYTLVGLLLPAAAAYSLVRDNPATLAWIVLACAAGGPVLAAAVARLPWRPLSLLPRWQWALTLILLAAIALPVRQGRAFRFESWEAARPIGAVRFLIAHHVIGPIFNTPDQGGYLMWQLGPERRIFTDGRRLNANVAADARRIAYNISQPGARTPLQLLDQYGVQAILIAAFDYPTGSPHFLIAALADPAQTQWKLVYQDGQGMVYLREVPAGVRPLANIAGFASMEAQCAAHIRLVPNEPLCARETCKMYEHLGNLDRARFWMAYYLQHKKQPDPAAEVEYQRLIRIK
jgi:hypothetical protein